MIVHEEEDEIVGVAFVKPKPGIFAAEINQLLIVSTVKQVKIIAASYNQTSGLKVFQTNLNTTSSGVNMRTIVGTETGRVFMLGNDGNIWELDYRVRRKKAIVCVGVDTNRILSTGWRNMVFWKVLQEITYNWKHLVIYYPNH